MKGPIFFYRFFFEEKQKQARAYMHVYQHDLVID